MNRISKLRSRLGLSQSDFADLLNLNKGNLAMIEIGKRNLNAHAAIIAAKLEEMLDAFLPAQEPEDDQTKARLAHAAKCRAKITQLEEEREKAKASLDAAKRCLFLAQQLKESPFLPDTGVIYQRIELIGRYAMEVLQNKDLKRDWWYLARIEGLRKEAEMAESGLV
jgi:transcriptional regulator with XRE-family HTH domain